MADKNKIRNLTIKTGIVKRYAKEIESYEKEVEMQKKKIEKFTEEGRDEYFMKQQKECLKESEMMIPDICRRLVAAHAELELLTSGEAAQEFGEAEEFKLALKVLQESKTRLPPV